MEYLFQGNPLQAVHSVWRECRYRDGRVLVDGQFELSSVSSSRRQAYPCSLERCVWRLNQTVRLRVSKYLVRSLQVGQTRRCKHIEILRYYRLSSDGSCDRTGVNIHGEPSFRYLTGNVYRYYRLS